MHHRVEVALEQNATEVVQRSTDTMSPWWHGRGQLALVNFFGTVVKDGLAPFVSVYLVTTLGWSPGQAGVVWFAREMGKLVAQAPAGHIVDRTAWKRTLLAFSALLATVPAATIIWWNSLSWMVAKAVIEGIASAIIEPAKAAVALGVVGPKDFDRVSRTNEMCDHAGTLFCAIAGGVVAYASYPDVGSLFIVVSAMGTLAAVAALLIPSKVRSADGSKRSTINDSVARGDKHVGAKADSVCELFRNINIPIFSACCFFFHFGNAAVLPLLGQYIAAVGDARGALPYTAANIAIAQTSATFFAWTMGKMLDRGYSYRAPVLLGFGSLPVRCGVILALVYAWPNPYALIATQVIDGVGAGVYGLAQITITRALTQGTGRFGATLGLMIASHACGAAASNLIAGYVVDATSYTIGFIFLGGIALIPIALLFVLRVPTSATLEEGGASELAPSPWRRVARSAMRAWSAGTRWWGVALVLFAISVIMSGIGTRVNNPPWPTENVPWAVDIVLFWIMLAWIAMLEGCQISIVGLRTLSPSEPVTVPSLPRAARSC